MKNNPLKSLLVTATLLGTAIALQSSCVENQARPDPAPASTAADGGADSPADASCPALTWKEKCLSYIADAQRHCTNHPEVCTTPEYQRCINETSWCYALSEYGELNVVEEARFQQVVNACKQYAPHIVATR